MREQVERFLTERFEGIVTDFGPQMTADRRLSGVLVWDQFEGLSVAQRQNLVWDALRERFAAEATLISTLVTMTPEEYGALASTPGD
jgi:stress-induced morphogen